MEKNYDPVHELSQKMLSGWTLLAESCSFGCNVPLVENKKQHKIVCVGCDKQFMRDPNRDNEMLPIAPSDSTLSMPTTAHEDTNACANNNIKANNISPDGNSTNGSNNTSNLLNKNSNVGEGSNIESNSNKKAKIDPQSDEDSIEDEDFYVFPYDEDTRKKRDRASVAIGEKLLAGWTMLDLHCPNPNCMTVLMKDRENQKWCLACGTLVVSQDEFDALKHVVSTPKLTTTTTAPTLKCSTSSLVSKGPTPKPPTTEFERLQPPSVQPIPTPVVAVSPPSPLIRSGSSTVQRQNGLPMFSLPIAHPTQNQIVESSLQTLYQKLNEYTRILSITDGIQIHTHQTETG